MKDIFKEMGVKRMDFDSKGKITYIGGSFKKSDLNIKKEDLKKRL